jgi:hypothetical protein
VSRADIPPKEKKISRDDQEDPRDGTLQTSQHGIKVLCHETKHISFIASRTPISSKEKEALKAGQRDSGNGKLQTSIHSLKRPYHEKERISSHATTADIPSNEKDLKDDQTRSPDGKLKSSQRLCHEKKQISTHVSRVGNTPKEKNITRTDQSDSQAGGLDNSQHAGSVKCLQPSAEVLKGRSGDPDLAISSSSTLPNFKHFCPNKDQLTFHAGHDNIQHKKRKDLSNIQTNMKDGEVETWQYSPPIKKFKQNAEVPERRSGENGPESSKSTTSPNCTRFSLHNHQLKSHASSGHIKPKENKTSRDNQTDTREEKLENSRTIKCCGATMDISDAESEASCPPPSSIENKAALSNGSHTTKYSTRRSSQTDAANSSAVNRPIPKLSGDEQKAWDDDTSFFRSLIPHVKELSPKRKMLLRIKTQELIYNYVYSKKN